MKTAVIYGSTGTGKSVYSQVKEKYNILYFVDENPKRIGEKNGLLEIKPRENILNDQPDLVVLAQLTGYEEAEKWLIDNGISEERVIKKYVDLPARARRDCLKKYPYFYAKNAFRWQLQN